jgi:hypothetical protein
MVLDWLEQMETILMPGKQVRDFRGLGDPAKAPPVVSLVNVVSCLHEAVKLPKATARLCPCRLSQRPEAGPFSIAAYTFPILG